MAMSNYTICKEHLNNCGKNKSSAREFDTYFQYKMPNVSIDNVMEDVNIADTPCSRLDSLYLQ